MCKPKNRVMCPDSGRLKMLFESESKANNFIKWNKDNIDNGDKLRSYYCPACCGWHITHMKYHKSMDNKTDNMIEAYHRSQQKWPANYDQKVIELYNLLNEHKIFNSRKEVNAYLKTLDYAEVVKFKARVIFYNENNL